MCRIPTPIQDPRDFYDNYWMNKSEDLNEHQITRLSEVLRAIESIIERGDQPIRKICDLGCGTGWLSNELCKFGNVIAVDFSSITIERASQKWKDVTFEAQNILSWRPNTRFDLVVSSEVVEHIEDKTAFVETIKYILKPGGWLILTTPNRKVKYAWNLIDHEDQIVEKWLTPKELDKLFSEYFHIKFRNTFFTKFSHDGVFRILNSYKLLSFLSRLDVIDYYFGLLSVLQFGLYQIIVGRMKQG